MQYIVKFFGLALITAATTGIGIGLSNQLKNRVIALDWYVTGIKLMSDKIRYSSAELTKVVTGLPMSDKYFSVRQPFQIALKKSGLEETDEKVIYEFFGQLGMGDTEQQVKICAMYESELTARLNFAKQQHTEKSKMLKSLGFFGGLGIAIILI